jgi:hypothetical protein
MGGESLPENPSSLCLLVAFTDVAHPLISELSGMRPLRGVVMVGRYSETRYQ